MESSSSVKPYEKDLKKIKFSDTVIPKSHKNEVPEEDYVYYYLDSRVKRPAAVERYTPNIYQSFHNYGHKKQERLIYPESEGYLEEEEEKYNKFLEWVETKNIELPREYSKREIMRVLYGNKFDHKDTVKSMKAQETFKKEKCPIILNDNMKSFIDTGFMYLHGRDRCLRPMFFIQSIEICKTKIPLEDVLNSSLFITLFSLENMCVDGKVENWVSTNDMGNISMMSLPVKFIGNLLKLFQEQFLCRGKIFLLLNVTFGVRAVWKLLSPFVDANTHARTVITAEMTCKYFEDCVHPSQLEERFGGASPNLERYWPPPYISDEFGLEGDDEVPDEN